MAAKTPVKATFTGSDVTGLAEFQTADFIAIADGGTGLGTVGSAGQVLKVNSGGTALEYGNVEAIVNIDGATDLTSATLATSDLLLASDGGTEGRITLGQIDTLFSGTSKTLTNKTISTLTVTGQAHTITDTTAGSSAGPELSLVRDITGADSNYIGQIKFVGDNDADQSVNFAKITGKIGDASDGSEDGIIEIAHIKGGSQNINVRMTSTEFKIMNGTDFDIETHDGSSNGLRLGNTLVTATAAELNHSDGVTSNIQTQIDTKASTAFAIAQAVALG